MENQSLLSIRLDGDDNKNNKDVVIQVKDKLTKLLNSPTINMEESPSIYKIPPFIRDVQPKAFEPQLVSFGPYHHGKDHLLSMEVEKLKALHNFKTKCGLEVESIVKNVSSILKDLRRSYDKLDDIKNLDSSKFLQLMVVDGCFLLEFFRSDCPPLLKNMRGDIKRDMLLLENQLPWVLLQTLDSMANKDQPQSETVNLKDLVCESLGIQKVVAKCLHILDIYKVALLTPLVDRRNWSETEETNEVSKVEYQIILPATQLREAGVKFKKSESESFTDVSFDPKSGVLRLPPLVVDDDTEANLLNVMAFEKLHVRAGKKVTSFVLLMNNLIDADKDVALLASEKILANALGNDQDAAELFSLLGKGAAMDLDSNITSVHSLVNKHCNKPWNQWWASLKHDYFHNPWTMISVIAAILGFALLIVQFLYQLFDYYFKK